MAGSMDDVSGEFYKAWEKGMTAWWDQVLESPVFLKNLGEGVSAQSQARGAWEQQVDQGLEQLHVPSRKDLLRVARICSMLEDRLLQLEDRILGMEDRLGAIEKHALQARIESAETRLELQERLGGIDAKLEALLAARTPAAAPAPTRTRKKAVS